MVGGYGEYLDFNDEAKVDMCQLIVSRQSHQTAPSTRIDQGRLNRLRSVRFQPSDRKPVFDIVSFSNSAGNKVRIYHPINNLHYPTCSMPPAARPKGQNDADQPHHGAQPLIS